MSTSTESTMRREPRMGTRITPYLRFHGNCRRAMAFYHDSIGGKLEIMTVGDSPEAVRLKDLDPKLVFHASLKDGSFELFGSDIGPEEEVTSGNSITLVLECNTEADVRKFYSRLSAGGKQTFPVAPAFWGGLYGQLTDKYGMEWILTYRESGSSRRR
jgi:PhnB protein